MNPLVSVIIPSYNAERWIGEAIESALAQTWPRTEIIVIDDGSDDGTLGVARRYQCSSLKIHHQRNAGVSAARNAGFRLAQGDFIQWLDADDVLHREKIATQVSELLALPARTVATGPFGAFFFRTSRASFTRNALWTDLSPREWLLTRFENDAWIALNSWLIERSLCSLAGDWNTRLALDEDGEYLSRVVALSSGVRFVSKSFSYYRRGVSYSLSSDRSSAAIRSLAFATETSIRQLLALDGGERSRVASLRFIQHRVNYYCAGRPEQIEVFGPLVESLGARADFLTARPSSWLGRRFPGRFNGRRLRRAAATARFDIRRGIDWLGYQFQRL